MGEDSIEVMVADLPRLRGCLLPFAPYFNLLFPPYHPPKRQPSTMTRSELLELFLESVGFLDEAWWEAARPRTWDPSTPWISFLQGLREYSFRPQDFPFAEAMALARERGIRLVRIMSIGDGDRRWVSYVPQDRARQSVETAYEPLGVVAIDGEDWIGPFRDPEAVLTYYSKADLDAG